KRTHMHHKGRRPFSIRRPGTSCGGRRLFDRGRKRTMPAAVFETRAGNPVWRPPSVWPGPETRNAGRRFPKHLSDSTKMPLRHSRRGLILFRSIHIKFEFAVSVVDSDLQAVFHITGDELFCKRGFDMPLDEPFQRTRAELGFVRFV